MGGWGDRRGKFAGRDPGARSLAAELLATGKLETDGLITHRFPLTKAGSAYELIHSRPGEVLRAILVYAENATAAPKSSGPHSR